MNFSAAAILTLCSIILCSCEKVERKTGIRTTEATATGPRSANLKGEITDFDEFGQIEYGFVYDTIKNLTSQSAKIFYVSEPKLGTFSSYLNDLKSKTTYYVRAYVRSGEEYIYGELKSFRTYDPTSSSVRTIPPHNLDFTSFTSGGVIDFDGGSDVYEQGLCWSISEHPRITDNHSTTNTLSDSFNITIFGLDTCQTYFIRAYAVNSIDTSYGNEIRINTSVSSFTDPRDGKKYKTVKIGNQIWMAQNLNFDTLHGTGSVYYNNDPANSHLYGKLYNWSTAMQSVPLGWHLPTQKEWENLLLYLGGEGSNSFHQIRMDSIYGFNPVFMNGNAEFWSSEENIQAYLPDIWSLNINYSDQRTALQSQSKNNFCGVRCVKGISYPAEQTSLTRETMVYYEHLVD